MPKSVRELSISGIGEVDLAVKVDAVDDPKAVVVIVHGLAEHSGRYDYVVDQLNGMNYTVYRFDARGHGNSGGERGYIQDFNSFIDDADRIVTLAQTENSHLPVFMLGHSMGGFVAAAYGVKYPDKLRGQILSGAAVIVQPAVEPLKDMDFDAAGHQMVPNAMSEQVCRDPQVVEAYQNDPLVLKEFQLRLVGEVFVKGAEWLMESMPSYQYPCIILHGSADQLVTPDASRYMHDHIGSADKTLQIYTGYYHEILNEPEKDQVLCDIDRWISERI